MRPSIFGGFMTDAVTLLHELGHVYMFEVLNKFDSHS